MLLVPYQEHKGTGSTKSLKINSNKHLAKNVKTQVALTLQKVSTQLNVNDITTFEHKHDVLCFRKRTEQNCIDNYLGESVRRLILDVTALCVLT